MLPGAIFLGFISYIGYYNRNVISNWIARVNQTIDGYVHRYMINRYIDDIQRQADGEGRDFHSVLLEKFKENKEPQAVLEGFKEALLKAKDEESKMALQTVMKGYAQVHELPEEERANIQIEYMTIDDQQVPVGWTSVDSESSSQPTPLSISEPATSTSEDIDDTELVVSELPYICAILPGESSESTPEPVETTPEPLKTSKIDPKHMKPDDPSVSAAEAPESSEDLDGALKDSLGNQKSRSPPIETSRNSKPLIRYTLKEPSIKSKPVSKVPKIEQKAVIKPPSVAPEPTPEPTSTSKCSVSPEEILKTGSESSISSIQVMSNYLKKTGLFGASSDAKVQSPSPAEPKEPIKSPEPTPQPSPEPEAPEPCKKCTKTLEQLQENQENLTLAEQKIALYEVDSKKTEVAERAIMILQKKIEEAEKKRNEKRALLRGRKKDLKKVQEEEEALKKKRDDLSGKIDNQNRATQEHKDNIEKLEHLANELIFKLVLKKSEMEADPKIVEKLKNEPTEPPVSHRKQLHEWQRVKDNYRRDKTLMTDRDKILRLKNVTADPEIKNFCDYELSQFDGIFKIYTESVEMNIERIKKLNDITDLLPLPAYPKLSEQFLEKYEEIMAQQPPELPTGFDPKLQCYICYENFKEGDKLLVCKECEKFTHVQCGKNWYVAQQQMNAQTETCAYCRSEMFASGGK